MIEEAKGGRGKCQYCGEFYNNVSLHEAMECEKAIRPWVQMPNGEWVQGAPQWVKDRMERLRKLPPPTLEEVVAQWKSSDEQLSRNPYKDQDVIR